jgi:hypothetical protein
VRWSWEVDPALDAEPPAVPGLLFTALGADSAGGARGRRAFVFERVSPAHGCRKAPAVFGADVLRLERSPDGAAAAMAASTEIMPWRLDRYGRLLFECRAGGGLRIELVLEIHGRKLVFPLVGGSGPVAADGAWRQVVLDLAARARDELGKLPLYCAWQVVLREPPGAARRPEAFLELRGPELWNGSTAGAAFLLSSRDAASGLAGFSVVVDHRPDTMPPEKINLPAAGGADPVRWNLGRLEPGEWWVHARAADLAGNWSGAGHLRFYVGGREP